MTKANPDRKRFIHSLVFPVFFLLIIWLIKTVEFTLDYSFVKYGVYPQRVSGLIGIILSPLIHGSFQHLISNSVPFLVLSVALFYFYKNISYKVFGLIYLFTGFWVWLAAREAYHIGVSGVIYGLTTFLFFSGLIHKNKSLSVISLLVVFLYGGSMWGVLPLKEGVSWESHLFGAITGALLSLWFARSSPDFNKEPKKYQDYSNINISYDNIKNINYFYEENKSDKIET